jgi:hypothetical protein
MKTRIILVSLFFIALSFQALCQTIDRQQQNAEFVLKLIQNSSTTEVIIYAQNSKSSYSSDWFSDISIVNGFICFKKKENIHYWNMKNIVSIEKNGTLILIRLDDNLGG